MLRELRKSLRDAQGMLLLGVSSAFIAALLVNHALGPAAAALLRGMAIPPLLDPLLLGLSLALTGAGLAWLAARAFETPGFVAAAGVGACGTLVTWFAQVTALGFGSLFAVPGSFLLRLMLAVLAAVSAYRAARNGLPLAARNPYAALHMAEAQGKPRVVIVGGGFGGLSAARALADAPVRVTLIDAHNHHTFQPLLYQVATAALPSTSIGSPLRRVLRHQGNSEVLMGRATAVDLVARQVQLEDGVVAYDHLILAPGSVDSYFGHDEWARYAPGLKTIGQALDIRNRILFAFEEAERETDPERRRALLTFAVVGGGPTGVELAGALSEIARDTLQRDFRHIDAASARIILVEAERRILMSFSPELSDWAQAALKRIGVELHLEARVTDVRADGITLKEGDLERPIACRTVIWAAGVKASPLGETLGVELAKGGRVPVEPDLTLAGHPEVSVVGDLASLTIQGKPVPGLAPAAIQEGKHAARNVLRRLENQPPQPFHYLDKGSLATIGRVHAVGQIGRFRFHGVLAWLVWVFVHILYLVGFRNRYLVLTEWAFSYVTHDRGARLIAVAGEKELPGEPVVAPPSPV